MQLVEDYASRPVEANVPCPAHKLLRNWGTCGRPIARARSERSFRQSASWGTPANKCHLVAALTQRLRELGWIEGRTVTVD